MVTTKEGTALEPGAKTTLVFLSFAYKHIFPKGLG
jgi:hypothetical protein